jgi:hypothetical protein
MNQKNEEKFDDNFKKWQSSVEEKLAKQKLKEVLIATANQNEEDSHLKFAYMSEDSKELGPHILFRVERFETPEEKRQIFYKFYSKFLTMELTTFEKDKNTDEFVETKKILRSSSNKPENIVVEMDGNDAAIIFDDARLVDVEMVSKSEAMRLYELLTILWSL